MHRDNQSSLRLYMNWFTLAGLREFPYGPLQAIRDAGYDGVQFINPHVPAWSRKHGSLVWAYAAAAESITRETLTRLPEKLGTMALSV